MTKLEEVDLLLAKAKESLSVAQLLFPQGFTSAVASHAYYAMFYAAEAALGSIRVRHGGHESTLELFEKRICVAGWLDPRFHRMIEAAYKTRLQADYQVQKQVEPERTKELISEAGEFVTAVSGWIEDRKKEGRP